MESNLGWLLSRAAFSWRAAVDKYMAELGLTQTRWIALLHLQRMGEGCTQSALAANIGVEQPSLLRTLNQLEEAGLVERRPSPADARCRTLWFTPKGLELIQEVAALAAKGRQDLLEGLSSQQRQTLHEVLETVISNAQSVLAMEKK
ncbi:MarR family transcriptional regulator [Gallaecimonas xiamenensis]|uniref:Transcriptional regulator SlyA n=1 Tax=Gallaecimonas xiamenensis 3-C-1 TaxID=745411 RepID=K2JI57_9GAMM|nr:MarR family transcriptional regulator [Gallaecimonas xiamenensis]EKE74903.1 transcriptional regulator SlyA [Gallaecimonas xiamenensis 3-C-1]